MAIPGITYRLEQGSSLTHTQMDNNFRSVIYSSSVQDGGDTLWLHFDTAEEDKYIIPLNGGTGGLTITGNVNNYIVTATGTPGLLAGESNLQFDGDVLTITGRVSQDDGNNNIFIGEEAGDTISGAQVSVGIGYRSSKNLTGYYNTALGVNSLLNALAASSTVALGFNALTSLTSGNNNVSVGASAGLNLTSGAGNVHLGNAAGPGASIAESNKLYINNAASDTPLVLGDFSTQQITFSGGVTGSSFTGSFVGDGSGLTGLTVVSEWDGSLNGNGEITGSFTVSGSAVTVDFTNTLAISGSIFSGSFVGDGSGLTGVQADTFPYTGSAIISGSLSVIGLSSVTGSFVVSGSTPTIDLKGVTTIDQNIKIYNPTTTTISIGKDNFTTGGTAANSVIVGYQAGQATNGANQVVIGAQAMQSGSSDSIAIGICSFRKLRGSNNVAIGTRVGSAFDGCTPHHNVGIGTLAFQGIQGGSSNVAIGSYSQYQIRNGYLNTSVGDKSLRTAAGFTTGQTNYNTALGACAGYNLYQGTNNVYIGYKAGPSIQNATQSNRLYIASSSGTPLIYGDFSTSQVEFAGGVTGSSFTGSFVGDGSALTGITATVFPYNGDAVITGSLTVSGSSENVDFLGAEGGVSGSFSGSFVGDGSGLTGVTSEWDGSRNGDASITGSLIVSGALDVSNTITLASTGYPGGPGVELIHFHSSSLVGVHNIHSFSIHSSTGYTGFKADYSLTNTSEDQKKIGTLLGAWDQSGGETINDSHTIATGDIVGTSFSIDSNGSTAILKLDASTGTYDVNILITAFKRQV
jgi:hypothetical protein